MSGELVVDDLQRQVTHWRAAARTFLDAEEFASDAAWRSIEAEVGLPLRRQLGQTVERLLQSGRTTADLVRAARTDPGSIAAAGRAVQQFRRLYSQVEATLEFFGHAVNSRTSPTLRVGLASLDRLAVASMEPVLGPLGKPVPPVLTYIDQGMGASILRAGIRLWAPGMVNPVAAIKVVRHNLYRPTSLFHETGHQVAAQTGWAEAFSGTIDRVFGDDPALRSMWHPWSAEIVADVFAFVHTGYASIAALYDVVGDDRTILTWPLGDPHPVGWLRTLLGIAMARHAYGSSGPWESLEDAMLAAHPVERAEPTTAALLVRSRRRLPTLGAACLETRVPGMGGRPVTAFVDPARVSPAALNELEHAAGPSLWTSPHWQRAEGIRMIALAGLREAERPDRAPEWINRARNWLTGVARAA